MEALALWIVTFATLADANMFDSFATFSKIEEESSSKQSSISVSSSSFNSDQITKSTTELKNQHFESDEEDLSSKSTSFSLSSSSQTFESDPTFKHSAVIIEDNTNLKRNDQVQHNNKHYLNIGRQSSEFLSTEKLTENHEDKNRASFKELSINDIIKPKNQQEYFSRDPNTSANILDSSKELYRRKKEKSNSKIADEVSSKSQKLKLNKDEAKSKRSLKFIIHKQKKTFLKNGKRVSYSSKLNHNLKKHFPNNNSEFGSGSEELTKENEISNQVNENNYQKPHVFIIKTKYKRKMDPRSKFCKHISHNDAIGGAIATKLKGPKLRSNPSIEQYFIHKPTPKATLKYKKKTNLLLEPTHNLTPVHNPVDVNLDLKSIRAENTLKNDTAEIENTSTSKNVHHTATVLKKEKYLNDQHTQKRTLKQKNITPVTKPIIDVNRNFDIDLKSLKIERTLKYDEINTETSSITKNHPRTNIEQNEKDYDEHIQKHTNTIELKTKYDPYQKAIQVDKFKIQPMDFDTKLQKLNSRQLNSISKKASLTNQEKSSLKTIKQSLLKSKHKSKLKTSTPITKTNLLLTEQHKRTSNHKQHRKSTAAKIKSNPKLFKKQSNPLKIKSNDNTAATSAQIHNTFIDESEKEYYYDRNKQKRMWRHKTKIQSNHSKKAVQESKTKTVEYIKPRIHDKQYNKSVPTGTMSKIKTKYNLTPDQNGKIRLPKLAYPTTPEIKPDSDIDPDVGLDLVSDNNENRLNIKNKKFSKSKDYSDQNTQKIIRKHKTTYKSKLKDKPVLKLTPVDEQKLEDVKSEELNSQNKHGGKSTLNKRTRDEYNAEKKIKNYISKHASKLKLNPDLPETDSKSKLGFKTVKYGNILPEKYKKIVETVKTSVSKKQIQHNVIDEKKEDYYDHHTQKRKQQHESVPEPIYSLKESSKQLKKPCQHNQSLKSILSVESKSKYTPAEIFNSKLKTQSKYAYQEYLTTDDKPTDKNPEKDKILMSEKNSQQTLRYAEKNDSNYHREVTQNRLRKEGPVHKQILSPTGKSIEVKKPDQFKLKSVTKLTATEVVETKPEIQSGNTLITKTKSQQSLYTKQNDNYYEQHNSELKHISSSFKEIPYPESNLPVKPRAQPVPERDFETQPKLQAEYIPKRPKTSNSEIRVKNNETDKKLLTEQTQHTLFSEKSKNDISNQHTQKKPYQNKSNHETKLPTKPISQNAQVGVVETKSKPKLDYHHPKRHLKTGNIATDKDQKSDTNITTKNETQHALYTEKNYDYNNEQYTQRRIHKNGLKIKPRIKSPKEKPEPPKTPCQHKRNPIIKLPVKPRTAKVVRSQPKLLPGHTPKGPLMSDDKTAVKDHETDKTLVTTKKSQHTLSSENKENYYYEQHTQKLKQTPSLNSDSLKKSCKHKRNPVTKNLVEPKLQQVPTKFLESTLNTQSAYTHEELFTSEVTDKNHQTDNTMNNLYTEKNYYYDQHTKQNKHNHRPDPKSGLERKNEPIIKSSRHKPTSNPKHPLKPKLKHISDEILRTNITSKTQKNMHHHIIKESHAKHQFNRNSKDHMRKHRPKLRAISSSVEKSTPAKQPCQHKSNRKLKPSLKPSLKTTPKIKSKLYVTKNDETVTNKTTMYKKHLRHRVINKKERDIYYDKNIQKPMQKQVFQVKNLEEKYHTFKNLNTKVNIFPSRVEPKVEDIFEPQHNSETSNNDNTSVKTDETLVGKNLIKHSIIQEKDKYVTTGKTIKKNNDEYQNIKTQKRIKKLGPKSKPIALSKENLLKPCRFNNPQPKPSQQSISKLITVKKNEFIVKSKEKFKQNDITEKSSVNKKMTQDYHYDHHTKELSKKFKTQKSKNNQINSKHDKHIFNKGETNDASLNKIQQKTSHSLIQEKSKDSDFDRKRVTTTTRSETEDGLSLPSLQKSDTQHGLNQPAESKKKNEMIRTEVVIRRQIVQTPVQEADKGYYHGKRRNIRVLREGEALETRVKLKTLFANDGSGQCYCTCDSAQKPIFFSISRDQILPKPK